MKRILYSRKFWVPLILLITGLLSIVLYKYHKILIKNWFDTLSITFGLVGMISTMFTYWRKFNLFITRLWIILSNSSAIWNISANFQGDLSISDFHKIVNKLKNNKNVLYFQQRSNNMAQMNIDGLHYTLEYVELSTWDDRNCGEINCFIEDFNSSYDYSIKILEENIIPYLRLIENFSKVDNKMFNFKISFKNRNPFIKLIAQNVNEKSINDIWYSLREETKVGKRDVRISKKSIECTTTDITDFQRSSINFISLVGDS